MKWLERLRVWNYLRKLPNLRDDCRTYALRGDNLWGDSITWWQGAPTGHEGRVYGWVPRRPRVGDRVAVEMQSGRWAAWVFKEVDPCRDPPDMFFATVAGPIGYLEDAEVPATASSGTITGVMADYV